MSAHADWPALRQALLPARIAYGRAVLGKVHGARTDFRWIARTDGFGADRPDLQRQLNLGTEDLPAHFQAWRNMGDRCYAVTIYPSRASDAAGRYGFLEKQVLEWRRPPDVPAALGALVLLPHVAALTDAIWWNRDLGELCSDPDAVFPIAEEDAEPCTVLDAGVSDAIARGRQLLLEAVSPQALERCYAQLLTRTTTAYLSGLRKPLPAEAIAALLLPLPRDVADRISIAGWIPASRPAIDDLAARWDVLVLAPEHAAPSVPITISDEAGRLARTVLDHDPPRHDEVEEVETIDEASLLPVASSTSKLFRPGIPLDITPPDPEAAPIIHQLYEFAAARDRRWMSPETLRPSTGRLRFSSNESSGQLLCNWADEVRIQPQHADPRQWDVKVDLLRSAAIVLVPEPATLGRFRNAQLSGRVPLLFFARMLKGRAEWDELAGIGEEGLRWLLEQSVNCGFSSATSLNGWLTSWQETSTRIDVDVRRLIREVRRSHSA